MVLSQVISKHEVKIKYNTMTSFVIYLIEKISYRSRSISFWIPSN